MRFHLETINEFETILNCLDSNNNNLIRALSLFAEEHKENKIVAPAFVNLITTKIIEAPQNLKIYFLYVLDCIVKNVGYLYIDLFAKSLKEIFIFSLSSVADVRERPKYYLMRKSWENYFVDELLNEIDLALDEIDPNWRSEISISITDIANKTTTNNNNNINYESLQSLPIISNKAKFDNFLYLKEDECTPYIDCNKENENLEFPIISRPIWKVDIPEYPLFPDIGTDPRLLRQWYTNEITQRIIINNRDYELLLNRIQPCIFVNDTLHAVRFYSKKIQLIVNDNLFDISISGASLIRIFDQSFYVCLGGPWHEFIITGLPYNVPFDGYKHRIRFNNENVYLQWVTTERNVQVNIMPGIPSHISEWGWRGMFGSPKYLTQRPLNPMKPPETFIRSKMNNKSHYYKSNRFDMTKENQKVEDWNKINKIPLESKTINSNLLKTTEELLENNGGCRKISLNLRQKLNREVICQLYSSKKCSICDLTFSYSDKISLASHFLQHKTSNESRYQLLTDWIVSDFPVGSNIDNHSSDLIPVRPDQIDVKSPTESISFDDLVNIEVNTQLDYKNGNIIVLNSEEIIRFYCENRVIIRLIKGTAEIHGTALPFNNEIKLVNNTNYEILSFTGCKLCVIGNIKDVQIKSFSSDFYKPNILLNVHNDLELKRIEASEIEGRGPRILIYGPGVEAFSMSTLTRTLGNYAVRCNRTVALVNLDTIYNDTGLPNSISVNVIHAEFDIHHWWDPFSEPLVFNFGQCSPVANRHLYFEQLDALANFVNIRCENDNNLLVGGCIINGGSFHSSEIILKAIQLFEVNFILFISDKDSIKLNSQVPEYVQVINIPKNLFDTNFCPKKIEIIRTDRIDTYFNGNILIHKLYQHILKADKIKVFYTKSLNDSNGSNFIHMHFSEILNNSVGAISQALTPDKISTSPILFYLLITDISGNNSTVTVMSERKLWPDCYSILLLNGIVLENK